DRAHRRPAHPWRRRRLDRVHPPADHRRARPGGRGADRLDRARRGLRPRRPDRGDVRRAGRRRRRTRYPARGDRSAHGGRPRQHRRSERRGGHRMSDAAATVQEEEKQERSARLRDDIVTTMLAIVAALLIGAVLIAFSYERSLDSLSYVFSYPQDFFRHSGDAIWTSYEAMVKGSVGSISALSETLERAAPLICAGLGVALAFRAGLFNIGAQGQMIVA